MFGCVFVAVSEIAETNIGLATSVTKYKTDKGVRLLHNSDIQKNRIVIRNDEFITEEFALKNRNKILHSGDIISVHTGDVGTSAVITDEYDGAIGFTTITSRIKNADVVLPEYLCNYLNSSLCKQQIAAVTISDRNNLNQGSFDKLIVPLPMIEKQKEINAVLRNMDQICNDLETGLPAEIEARQKQYEYYRDKLLTFKEKSIG